MFRHPQLTPPCFEMSLVLRTPGDRYAYAARHAFQSSKAVQKFKFKPFKGLR